MKLEDMCCKLVNEKAQEVRILNEKINNSKLTDANSITKDAQEVIIGQEYKCSDTEVNKIYSIHKTNRDKLDIFSS